VEGLELGGLVDHVFRGGDLAAVVQPGGDMQGFPVIVTELERGIGTAGGLAGGCRQGLGQQGHPGAVTAGVGALGIDRPGDQLHEGLKQGLLGGDQAAGL